MRRARKKQVVTGQRKHRTRARILGTASRPRLSVFRSSTTTYLQLIDDTEQKTLFSVSTRGSKEAVSGERPAGAEAVAGKSAGLARAFAAGKRLGEKALEAGVKEAAFDRGAYQYHGRVKAAAEGAREGGLKI